MIRFALKSWRELSSIEAISSTGPSGPGLLESAYELLFCAELKARGLSFECQLPVPVEHRGVVIENAFRADIPVEGCLLIELKSTEAHAPVHA